MSKVKFKVDSKEFIVDIGLGKCRRCQAERELIRKVTRKALIVTILPILPLGTKVNTVCLMCNHQQGDTDIRDADAAAVDNQAASQPQQDPYANGFGGQQQFQQPQQQSWEQPAAQQQAFQQPQQQSWEQPAAQQPAFQQPAVQQQAFQQPAVQQQSFQQPAVQQQSFQQPAIQQPVEQPVVEQPVQQQVYNCQTCNAELKYIDDYQRWYCYTCQKYL